MKNAVLKRWIFVALLLILIAGTILGHADVANPDQNQVAITGKSPVSLAQTMDEIARTTKKAKDVALAGPDDTMSLAPVILPLGWLYWTAL